MVLSNLPPHSRIWIYQSPRPLTIEEVRMIKDLSLPFLKEWTSHKMSMDAALEVLYDRFVVLAVDEQTAPASGCGIDDSVRFIKMLSQRLGVDLLDRTTVYFRNNGNIEATTFQELGKGQVKKQTKVFNNMVQSLGELRSSWEMEAGTTWMANFLG